MLVSKSQVRRSKPGGRRHCLECKCMRAVTSPRASKGPVKILIADTGLRPCFPIEEDHVARAGHQRMSDGLDELPVFASDRSRSDDDAAISEIDQPGQFRGNGIPGMITLPVHPQRPFASGRTFDCIGCVLGQVDEADLGILRNGYSDPSPAWRGRANTPTGPRGKAGRTCSSARQRGVRLPARHVLRGLTTRHRYGRESPGFRFAPARRRCRDG